MSELNGPSARQPSRLRSGRTWAWLGLLAAAIAVGVSKGASAHSGGDFHVFWHAGREFARGAPLYDAEPGLRAFLYPPFAAFSFQIISWLPFSVAAGLFAAANVILWALAVFLARRVCQHCGATQVTTWSTVAAVVLSARYFRGNTSLIQVNAVVFCLVLGGIDAYLQRRRGASAALLCAAAWLKVTPALVVLWAVLRGGRPMVARVALFGTAFLILPMLQRGSSTGVNDLLEFREQLGANVIAVSDASPGPPQNLRTVASALLGGSDEVAGTNSNRWADASALGLLVMMVFVVLQRARRSLDISALELTLPILIAHLLPGKTQKHHLITLVFVFQAHLCVSRDALKGWQRAVLYVGWALAAVVSLGGRSLVGRELHAWMAEIGFLALCLLYWLVAAILFMLWERTPSALDPSPSARGRSG